MQLPARQRKSRHLLGGGRGGSSSLEFCETGEFGPDVGSDFGSARVKRVRLIDFFCGEGEAVHLRGGGG